MPAIATSRTSATVARRPPAPEFTRLCPLFRPRKPFLSVTFRPRCACRSALRRNFGGIPDTSITVIASSSLMLRIIAPTPDFPRLRSHFEPIGRTAYRRLNQCGFRRKFGKHHRAAGSLARDRRDGASDEEEV